MEVELGDMKKKRYPSLPEIASHQGERLYKCWCAAGATL
jgi:hypothetical protein